MKSRGITFLEIIAIVVVLLIPAAIFMPVIAGNRGPHRSHCLSNLKQLGLASITYSSDYDDRLMDRDQWMDLILAYHKNPPAENCPEVAKGNDNSSRLYGYSLNSLLSQQNIVKLADANNTVLLYDSSNLARNASDPLLSFPKPVRHEGNPRRYPLNEIEESSHETLDPSHLPFDPRILSFRVGLADWRRLGVRGNESPMPL
jgi:hypothetical protein